MKKLRMLLTALPLVIGINSCSWFVHPTPAPINSNTNDKPVTNLYVNPISGQDPLNAEIKVSGTDSDDGIAKYRAEIDYNNDGTIDEIISDSKPIDITRTFTANAMVYGQCTDKGGLTDRKGTLITVSEPTPIPPANIPPIANLSATPASGEYPLNAEIKVSGTDPDDQIVDYKLQIDIGANGTIDETVEQSTPIDITRIFNPGNVIIYGTCTDDKGAVSQIKTLEIVVSQRNDLVSNVTLGTYKVGDNFDFSAQVQNSTINDVTIDNSNKDSLEYKLIKNDGTVVLDKMFDQQAKMVLHQNGYIKLDYNGTNVGISLANGYAILDGTPIDSSWGNDNVISFSFGNQKPLYIFSNADAGNYYLETVVKYSMNGNNYEVKLDSSSFAVNQ